MITQGKWYTEKKLCGTQIITENDSVICFIFDHVEDERKRPIGSIASQDKTQEEIESNARLIAAAPDLLEACKFVLKCLKSTSDLTTLGDLIYTDQQIITNAINKAEKGE